jgi:hypothetical protein
LPEKEDFRRNCSVLVRLLQNNAVDDINKVVKSTNNQNPMKPRNLMSNANEQLEYVRIFADQLGWFYEPKEGAWDAFENDHKRWRPNLNKHPKHFRNPNNKIKRIDNEELAQTWLAFIGFAHEAVNQKRHLFEPPLYDLIFKKQPSRHGFDYDFSTERAREDATDQSPSVHLMLAAYLAREFAQGVTLKASENRREASERLRVRSDATKAETDALLIQDNQFVLNQVLRGMSTLFTEFLGFVFFRAFGENVHDFGERIIRNHSFYKMACESIDVVKPQVLQNKFEERDLLIVLWFAFVDTVEDMVLGSWGQSYRAAPVNVRFIYSAKETRQKLYQLIQNTDQYMQKKKGLKIPWATGVTEGQGFFNFIRSCI